MYGYKSSGDDFFTKRNCDRCGTVLTSRIMSMLNTDVICMTCKEIEREDPLYASAREAESEEVRKGNTNYRGLYAD